ncbi:MAG: hypothetical protein L6425_08185 [Candidatus Aminicenantes bacterium]|nr:hypothetical protein [Candidatus Aminicenantes bacterium]
MNTLTHLKKGFRHTGGVTRMVVCLFLINLLLALVPALPLFRTLQDEFASSDTASRMTEGFDYLWWEEFNDRSSGTAELFGPDIIGKGAVLLNLEAFLQFRFLDWPSSLLVFMLLYLVVHTFLAGGILSVFSQDAPRFSMKGFFAGAGHQFFRFLGLMALSWIFFILTAQCLAGALNGILTGIDESAVSEVRPFVWNLIFSAVVLAVLLFIQMVFDYARILTVLEHRDNIFSSAWRALRFVVSRPLSTLGLFYTVFVCQIAVSVLYAVLIESFPQNKFLTVLSAFFIQQLFIFSIIWIRCWLYASQLELFSYKR